MTKPEYCFTLDANLSSEPIGPVEGGTRVNVQYTNGRLFVGADSWLTKETTTKETTAQIDGATIVSGGDWVFINDDAVVDFDSRITVNLTTAGSPVGVRLRGRADLRDCRTANGVRIFKTTDEASSVISEWSQGFPADSFLPVVLGACFDVPLEGFKPEQTTAYKACRELARTLLIGTGRLVFQAGSFGSVKSIRLVMERYLRQLTADELAPTKPTNGKRSPETSLTPHESEVSSG